MMLHLHVVFGNKKKLSYSLLDKLIRLLDENLIYLVTNFSHELITFFEKLFQVAF